MNRPNSHEKAIQGILADSTFDENGVLVYDPQMAVSAEVGTAYDANNYEMTDAASQEVLRPMQIRANRRIGRKAITWTLAIGLVTGAAYATERVVVGKDINLVEHLQDYGKLPQTIPRVAQETSHNIEAVQQNADMIGKVFNQIFNQGNK